VQQQRLHEALQQDARMSTVHKFMFISRDQLVIQLNNVITITQDGDNSTTQQGQQKHIAQTVSQSIITLSAATATVVA
jgi:hypothetical protein